MKVLRILILLSIVVGIGFIFMLYFLPDSYSLQEGKKYDVLSCEKENYSCKIEDTVSKEILTYYPTKETKTIIRAKRSITKKGTVYEDGPLSNYRM